ncbi:MAG: S-DNA-T family DNA segregation ATPase FtsK/SpoIIIE [Acidimicrobiales bacterium]
MGPVVCVVGVSVVAVVVAKTDSKQKTASTRAKKPVAGRRTPAKKSGAAARKKPVATNKSRSREKSGRTRTAREGAHTPGTRDVVTPNAVRVLHGHRRDIWGVVFVALGLLTGLGVYWDAAGPLGNGLSKFFGGVVGLLRVALPVVFIAVGVVLIRGHMRRRSPRGTTGDLGENLEIVDDADQGTRLALGGMVAIIAAAGLLHLWAGQPVWNDSVDDFADAGGFLGWMIGAPLHAAFSSIGAAIVLIGLFIIGMVVITAMSVALWWGAGARRMDALGGSVQRFWGHLTGIEPRHALEDEVYAGDDILLEDPSAPIIVGGQQVGEYRRGEAATKPKRGRGKKKEAAQVKDTGSDPMLDADASASSAGTKATSFSEHTAVETPAQATPAAEEEPAPKPKPRKKPKIVVSDTGPGEQTTLAFAPSVEDSAWKLPPLNLLNTGGARAVDQDAVAEQGQRLERALASHGVDAQLVGMVVGPTVTRFELELGEGVKVARITSLNRDIAYAMASADVRILAPIPGRQAIGVEVPNADRQIVALGDLLRSKEAAQATHPMEVAIGRDIQGKAMLMNLAKMPHLLIAGATGSGKSSGINSIITSILMRSTPADVRMILVDPKMVEMTQYERVPHLLTQPVTDPRKAANALAWACREMDRRYELLAGQGFRDIAGFNKAFDAGQFDKENTAIEENDEDTRRTISRMPFILIVVDELADLMMVAARDVEDSICRIAQKARAVGIHLIIATQRPSTNVITGIIKANVPARIAFSVSSLTDSRVILDQPGAERLIGQGDMLMLAPTSSAPDRIQGCWVEEDEVKKVVQMWRKQADDFRIDESVSEAEIVEGSAAANGTVGTSGGGGGAGSDAGSDDELYIQARELVVSSQLGSTSMLQRKLKVGFARAGRLMDLLEENGIVGPSIGSKAREVLVSEGE